MITLPKAVFATSAGKNVSSKYQFIPTKQIVDILEGEGWKIHSAVSVKPYRKNVEHSKHSLRFTHPEKPTKNGNVPQLVLINSHDGGSAYRLNVGFFRVVCSNGLIVSDGHFESVNIRHISFTPEQVIGASKKALDNFDSVIGIQEKWSNREMSQNEKMNFFTDVSRLRWKDINDDLIYSVSTPRRQEDTGNDLWSVFNVAQENVIRGGFVNSLTRRKAKTIKNIEADFRLNTGIWDLAASYCN